MPRWHVGDAHFGKVVRASMPGTLLWIVQLYGHFLIYLKGCTVSASTRFLFCPRSNFFLLEVPSCYQYFQTFREQTPVKRRFIDWTLCRILCVRCYLPKWYDMSNSIDLFFQINVLMQISLTIWKPYVLTCMCGIMCNASSN